MLLPHGDCYTSFAVLTLTISVGEQELSYITNKSFHRKFNTSLKIMFIYKRLLRIYNSLKHNIGSPSFFTQPVLKILFPVKMSSLKWKCNDGELFRHQEIKILINHLNILLIFIRILFI